jgi:hypothetical protein
VLATLSVQWLTRNRFNMFGRGNLMISLDQPSFEGLEPKITSLLGTRLRGLKLQTMSLLDDRVSLHYQYRRQSGLDWASFTNELKQLGGQAKVEVFIE